MEYKLLLTRALPGESEGLGAIAGFHQAQEDGEQVRNMIKSDLWPLHTHVHTYPHSQVSSWDFSLQQQCRRWPQGGTRRASPVSVSWAAALSSEICAFQPTLPSWGQSTLSIRISRVSLDVCFHTVELLVTCLSRASFQAALVHAVFFFTSHYVVP